MSDTLKGGDIKQLTIGGVAVHPVEEGEFSYRLGGSELTGHKSGDGTFYATGKNALAYIKGPILGDTDDGVLEFLQGLADDGVLVVVTMTWFSGAVYSGKLLPMGELVYKSDGSIDLDLEGSSLEQQ
jgi:hypothetical protein